MLVFKHSGIQNKLHIEMGIEGIVIYFKFYQKFVNRNIR